MPIELKSLIADPGRAPASWQTQAYEAPGPRKPVAGGAELDRVLALPRRPRPSEVAQHAMAAVMTARLGRPPSAGHVCGTGPRGCITALRPVQGWALKEAAEAGGLLGIIGVGHGKTLLDLLLPVATGARTAVLLLPSTLVRQAIGEYERLRPHFRVPSLVSHGAVDYVACEGGDAPVLHLFPYSLLSRPRWSTFLDTLNPDTVIGDEADALRDRGATRTRRVLRGTGRRHFFLTGSMADASIGDYAHLADLALGPGSPLPRDADGVRDWGRAIDPSETPAPPGALLRLCAPGEHVRGGFARRLAETPGVITTVEASVDVGLEITERPAPPVPPVVADALGTLRSAWVRPDGEELVEALEVARSACELACGFYYRWTFPHREPVSLILEWLAARKAWNRELRDRLRDAEVDLDSPLLCARAAARAWAGEGDGPRWKAESWPRWAAVKGRVRPVTSAVRLHPFLAEDAAAWALDGTARAEPGIVWYQNREFGQWVAEVSRLPLHTGGPDAGARIAREDGSRSIIASMESHGRGRDGLQYLFHRQLFSQPPVAGHRWEQTLGRTHRAGQVAAKVYAEFYRHTPELADHVDTALARAEYVEETLGVKTKMLAGMK